MDNPPTLHVLPGFSGYAPDERSARFVARIAPPCCAVLDALRPVDQFGFIAFRGNPHVVVEPTSIDESSPRL